MALDAFGLIFGTIQGLDHAGHLGGALFGLYVTLLICKFILYTVYSVHYLYSCFSCLIAISIRFNPRLKTVGIL